MLRILGRPNSYNTQKVLWLLDEIGIPYSLELAGLEHGVNHTPDYNKLNPNELVPTLIEDDFVLWESNSIMRYLATKFGDGRFLPADPRDRARCERWLDWALTTLNPAITPAFWGLIRSKPEERDSGRIEEAVKKTNHAMTILDRYLTETPFVAGKEIASATSPSASSPTASFRCRSSAIACRISKPGISGSASVLPIASAS
jgi:glutathione S-transferase